MQKCSLLFWIAAILYDAAANDEHTVSREKKVIFFGNSRIEYVTSPLGAGIEVLTISIERAASTVDLVASPFTWASDTPAHPRRGILSAGPSGLHTIVNPPVTTGPSDLSRVHSSCACCTKLAIRYSNPPLTS